jgi:preprotein translocase SecE subunit
MGFFERVKQFVHEVAGEFRRVSWPNRAEVVNSTVVVLAVVVY